MRVQALGAQLPIKRLDERVVRRLTGSREVELKLPRLERSSWSQLNLRQLVVAIAIFAAVIVAAANRFLALLTVTVSIARA
jgi:hypothetical protein